MSDEFLRLYTFIQYQSFNIHGILVPFISEAATGGVLRKKVFLKISQNSRKTPVLKSLFNKVVGLACNFTKKRLQHRFSCEFRKIFKNTFFTEQLRATASVIYKFLLTNFYLRILFTMVHWKWRPNSHYLVANSNDTKINHSKVLKRIHFKDQLLLVIARLLV